MHRNAMFRAFLAALLLAVAGVTSAATATANLSVTATVSANCTISATPVAFGAYDTLSASNVTASGTINVACTKGATGLSVGLGNGANFTTTRNMNNGTDNLAYSLMQPTTNVPSAACPAFGAGTAWGNTVGTNTLGLSNAPNKNARTYNVCGQLAAGQDVSTGAYTDTVIATINF
jgi:spore coat protein U-like protein